MNAAAHSLLSSTRRARRNLFALGLTLLLASACGADNGGGGGEDDDGGPDPVCGDGAVNGQDQCDGEDLNGATCQSLGFADGVLACSSCAFDTTACIPVDADQDGIDYATELSMGLDPNNPDTDTDGFFDGHEIEEASDPLSHWSWPYLSGLWPHRLPYAQADGVTPTGWGVGQVPVNHIVTDQYGNQVQLHQFYGYKIVLSFGARWCGPCNEAAQNSETTVWTVLREQGFIVIEVLVQGLSMSAPATQDDASIWANQFGLTYPVTFGPPAPGISAIPTYYFINSDLTVGKITQGWPGDFAVTASAQALY